MSPSSFCTNFLIVLYFYYCHCKSWTVSGLWAQTKALMRPMATIPLTQWARSPHPVCTQPPVQHQLTPIPTHHLHLRCGHTRILLSNFLKRPIYFNINLVLIIASTLWNLLLSSFTLSLNKGSIHILYHKSSISYINFSFSSSAF